MSLTDVMYEVAAPPRSTLEAVASPGHKSRRLQTVLRGVKL